MQNNIAKYTKSNGFAKNLNRHREKNKTHKYTLATITTIY